MIAAELRKRIRTVLVQAGLNSESAVELLMGTSAVESNLGQYNKQLGGGPALGIFQMEPRTERDIWLRFIAAVPKLQQAIFDITGQTGPNPEALQHYLDYQILMARMHYYRVRAPLPPHDNIPALAAYWKKYYNTVVGKGRVEDFVMKYNKFCGQQSHEE